MGREVRMVPANWEHPKDEKGHYIPMHEHFPYNESEVEEGLRNGWLKGQPPHYHIKVMPDWPKAQRTHYQMYEHTSEGTPISPAMATPEELARWLADNKASAFAGRPASYEQWLETIRRGSSVTLAITAQGIISGVEAMSKKPPQ